MHTQRYTYSQTFRYSYVNTHELQGQGWMDPYLVRVDHRISTGVNGIMLIYFCFRRGQKQIVN